ncbi:MAG TPA: endonuclease/exonuclease/phosphatase family protein [Planctomycetes bacterium]|nr:endonuclease/exonuclease/phosphatase family protein [Fuerstiella sp.]HIK90873.1 endonuclease/exonuclease/phosphatase family protein [Planctomycetota bacterium]
MNNNDLVSQPDRNQSEPTQTGNRVARAVRDRMRRYTTVVVVALAAATFLSLLAENFWLGDLCANLRVQWVIGLIATAVVTCVFRRWRVLLLHVFLLAIHLPFFSTVVRQQTHDALAPAITVTTANVFTSNSNYAAIESQLRSADADIIAVLEISSGLRKHLANAFQKDYPFSLVDSQDNGNFGIGLYSRHRFESAKLTYFNEEAIQSIVAVVKVNGRRFQVVATHTLPPMGTRGFSHRNRHLQLLAEEVRFLQKQTPGTPIIVMGDLNLTPWSPIYANFEHASHLQRRCHNFDITPTWYRYQVFPFGLVLDHVLTTDELACSSYDVGTDVGSDHRFVTVGLDFTTAPVSPD